MRMHTHTCLSACSPCMPTACMEQMQMCLHAHKTTWLCGESIHHPAGTTTGPSRLSYNSDMTGSSIDVPTLPTPMPPAPGPEVPVHTGRAPPPPDALPLVYREGAVVVEKGPPGASLDLTLHVLT